MTEADWEAFAREDHRPRARCGECGRRVVVPAPVVLEAIEAGVAPTRWDLYCDHCTHTEDERRQSIRERMTEHRDHPEARDLARHAYRTWWEMVRTGEAENMVAVEGLEDQQ